MGQEMGDHHYTECGLDNMFIKDMNMVQDHGGRSDNHRTGGRSAASGYRRGYRDTAFENGR